MMPNAAGRLKLEIGSRRIAALSGAAILLAIAAPVGGAGAATRGGHEQPAAIVVDLLGTRAAVALPARRAAIADADGDGVVSCAEATRYYEARFALLDRNRDGRVSQSEFLGPDAPRTRHARDRTQPFFGRGAVLTGGDGAPAGALLESPQWQRIEAGVEEKRAALFDLLDVGRDGALSRQEVTEAGIEDFAASDTDRDGRVPLREFYAGTRL